MAKSAGGVRNVPYGGQAHKKRIDEVERMRKEMENGKKKYSAVKMFNTGWVAVESPQNRKNKNTHNLDEYEAAIHLARAGYKVTLKDESGSIETPDGEMFSFAYEQSTPKEKCGPEDAYDCIDHGASKIRKHWSKHHKDNDFKPMKIDVALIYDKYNRFTRTDIERGLEMFEQREKRIRYKQIIVIGSDGKIHVHKHNDRK